MELDRESRKFYLHPWLRKATEKIRPKRILDFGCGDGSLFCGFDLDCKELFFCDHSEPMLELAKNNFLKDPRCVFLTDGESLPTNHFDLIVFSSVLMTISSKRKLEKVVQKMRKCAVDRGQCLVADRVLRPEVAYRFVEGDQGEGVPVGLLKAKAAIVFNTANTPDARERKVFGDPLETLWKNCVFGLCGVKNVYRRTFSVVVTSTPRQRADWLVEVRKTVERIFPGRE